MPVPSLPRGHLALTGMHTLFVDCLCPNRIQGQAGERGPQWGLETGLERGDLLSSTSISPAVPSLSVALLTT